MKTLDRYVIRSFLFSVLLCLVVLMSLRVVADLFVKMDEFTERREPDQARTFEAVVKDISVYYGFQSLAYFRDLGGVIIVLAAGFTLARMNHTKELTAMLASGVSLHRVLLPIVLCAIGLNVLVILDTELLIPRFKHQLVRSPDDVSGTEAFQVRTVTDEKRSNWYSRRFYPGQGRLENPLILLRDERYAYVGHITGPQATYDERAGAWVLSSGVPNEAEALSPNAVRGASSLETSAPPPKPKGRPRYPVMHVAGLKGQPTTAFVPTQIGPEQIIEAARARPENRNVDWLLATGIRHVRHDDPETRLRILADHMPLKRTGQKEVSNREIRDLEPLEPRLTGSVLEAPRFEFRGRDGQLLGTFVARRATYRSAGRNSGWELDGGVLLYHTDLNPSDLSLRQSSSWLGFMSTAEITRLLRLQRVPDRAQAMLVRHSRFADFFNNIVMLIIGIPFILSRERKIKSSAGLAVLMLGGFYAFIYLSRYVGLPPLPAATLPVLIFGPVAAVMLHGVKT